MAKKTESEVVEQEIVLAEVPVAVCRCDEQARERGKVERQAAKVQRELEQSGAGRS